jgi:hypothetical protein
MRLMSNEHNTHTLYDLMQLRSEREHRLVYITPTPVLSAFNGTHQRMADRMKMLGGMLVFGGVAASYVSTHQTHSQVDPAIPHVDALLTNMRGGL